MHRNRRIQKNVKQTPRRATKKSIRLRRHIYFDSKHHPSNANKWIRTRIQARNKRKRLQLIQIRISICNRSSFQSYPKMQEYQHTSPEQD